MNIHLLSRDVASAIAAGEVIERPVSVVKELLENSLDAAARRIDIRLEGGGLKLIEVADDGAGIAAEDMPLAFSRFATSKLATLDDLAAIRTLGFRGEALASIAAVSRAAVSSRPPEADSGWRVRAEAGQPREPEALGMPAGTIVEVRDLFFNVPARLKFMRSEDSERRRVLALVSRYALAYPGVAFRLTVDGRDSLHTDGNGQARDVLAEIYGWEVARDMLPIASSGDGLIQVSGHVSPPTVHRSTRREVTLFVNGRWVQDAGLAAAVVQAYHGLLMVGRFPIAAVFVRLPADSVDVNVHPAKAEIRFRDASQAFVVVQRVIRATLLGHAPAADLGAPLTAPREPTGIGSDWIAAQAALHTPAGEGLSPTAIPGPQAPWLPLLQAVGQVGRSYLVAEAPDGVYLIDQHAAHERVLFESWIRQESQGDVPMQRLLEAMVVELTPAQADLLESQLGDLRHLGFEIETFGGNAFRISGMPELLSRLDPAQALRVLVEDFEEDERPLEAEREHRIAGRVCKRAAVKAGQLLSLAEQAELLRQLESCSQPRTCPHGRPTMIHISLDALERQFGRRG
jgi:DNA mismatch repair protein MutL